MRYTNRHFTYLLTYLRTDGRMLWMHYLVGVTHFAKCGTNRPLIVYEILTAIQKSPILQWLKK